MRQKPPLLILLAFLMSPALVVGQSYQLQSYVIGSGAMNGSSANFQALGTVGQPAIGNGSSANFAGSWGFWHTLSGALGGSGVLANLTVLLEGPYDASGVMLAGLTSSLPLSHPFGGSPWNYGGSESVSSGFFAANPTIVDWVFVQVRDTVPSPPSTMTVLAERAGFLKTDGSIVDTNGVDPLSFPTLAAGTYYVMIDHRNHIRVMSSDGLASAGGTISHDFTDNMSKAYAQGGNPMRNLGDGHFAMFTGDADPDHIINTSDFTTWLVETKAVATGYNPGDFDMDAQSLTSDFTMWLVNQKAVVSSQVPPP